MVDDLRNRPNGAFEEPVPAGDSPATKSERGDGESMDKPLQKMGIYTRETYDGQTVLAMYAGDYFYRITKDEDDVFENPCDLAESFLQDDHELWKQLEREDREIAWAEYLSKLPGPEKLVEFANQLQAQGWHLSACWDGSDFESLDIIWEEDEAGPPVARAFIPLHHVCGEPMLMFSSREEAPGRLRRRRRGQPRVASSPAVLTHP